jgi:hypothetical protein
MIAGGLTGGWLYRWQPQIARRPLTGFCLTFILLLLRDKLIFFWAPNSQATWQEIEHIAGRLQIFVRSIGRWLETTVRDDGKGMPAKQVEQLLLAGRPPAHALGLLRRRLQGLFGQAFHLEVRSEQGEGHGRDDAHPLTRPFAGSFQISKDFRA